MSEVKLFKLDGPNAKELKNQSVGLEKSLQTVLEKNLDATLGVKLLRSEYSTGPNHGGRIDTLGIDENNSPVIIEYKRSVNENVINQGLYYFDWLLDHKAEFKMLVAENYGKASADKIDWRAPRLICIASDFTKYDKHAVKQIGRNIDLVQYRKYETGLFALELVYRSQTNNSGEEQSSKKTNDKPADQWLEEFEPSMRDLYEGLRAFILALGEDVREKHLKLYVAFSRLKNFACVVPQKKVLTLYLKLNPKEIKLEKGFSRDVSKIGHWATGDVEITVSNQDDLKKAELLIIESYEKA